MKILAGITLIAAVMLSGCESQEVKQAKEAVANQLRDPESAQFRNMTETRKTSLLEHGVVTVCGEVNGKNAYGGYVGFQRFVSRPSVGVVYMENTWSTFDSVWSRHCSES